MKREVERRSREEKERERGVEYNKESGRIPNSLPVRSISVVEVVRVGDEGVALDLAQVAVLVVGGSFPRAIPEIHVIRQLCFFYRFKKKICN